MDALAQFDDAVNVRAPKVKGEKSAMPALPFIGSATIPNGTYTLEFYDGSHRTFRIHRKKDDAKFAPGKRMLSLLIGPDNSEDWEGFAFVTDQGIAVWKNKRGSKERPSKFEEYAMLLWSIAATGEKIEGYELHISKTCMRCNRLLTTPESIRLNLGPECARLAKPAV